MRVKQSAGVRGSLKWMQAMVRSHQPLLDDAIRATGVVQRGETLDWKSPRADDEYAEYRDGSFLTKIGQPQLTPALKEFWPARGPQWDALAVGSSGTVVLVEAKAHVNELSSTCQASESSRAKITAALTATKVALGVAADHDWTIGFYQYANRIAHLHFLHSHGVKAALVFLYFVGDRDMSGPDKPDGWKAALSDMYAHLGLNSTKQKAGLASIFIDTRIVSA